MNGIIKMSIALLVAAGLLSGCHYPHHDGDDGHGGKQGQEQKVPDQNQQEQK